LYLFGEYICYNYKGVLATITNCETSYYTEVLRCSDLSFSFLLYAIYFQLTGKLTTVPSRVVASTNSQKFYLSPRLQCTNLFLKIDGKFRGHFVYSRCFTVSSLKHILMMY
jgi:hypothetical protein